MNDTINKPFSFRARIRSAGFALEGILAFLSEQHNARVHLAATIGVVLASVLFPVNVTEAIILVFAVALVWAAEIFNTAIEKTIDFISTEQDERIRVIKDLAAAAVLIISGAALIAGCIIFIPKIIVCFQHFVS